MSTVNNVLPVVRRTITATPQIEGPWGVNNRRTGLGSFSYSRSHLNEFLDTIFPENTILGKFMRRQNIFPENTIIGKLTRGDDSWVDDFASFMDRLSGKNLEYQRSLEERAYLENYNSPSAQVARMLAAGLNPYSEKVSGISSGETMSGVVPEAVGTDITPYIFNGLNQALSSIGNIPEKFINLKAAQASIKSQELDNLEKESKLGLDADMIRKQLKKLDQQYGIDEENRARERERFDLFKRQQEDAHNESLKKLVTYDDQHRAHLHDVSQWTTDDLLKYAQLRALQDSHNQAEFVQNYLNQAQLAQIVAQTNHIMNADRLDNARFNEMVRQFDLTNEQAEKWRTLDHAEKLRIENLQARLLTGQISHIEYSNALEKAGLSIGSPRSMKKAAGLIDGSMNSFDSFGADILDGLYSIPRAFGSIMH